MHTFNSRAMFVRASRASVQRPDYMPAYQYNPDTALRAQAMARSSRRRAACWAAVRFMAWCLAAAALVRVVMVLALVVP